MIINLILKVKVGIIGLIYIAGGSAADLFFSILIFKN